MNRWERRRLRIVALRVGWLRTNCYLIAPAGGDEALIVDPADGSAQPLLRLLGEQRLTPRAVLLTHGHLDHVWMAQQLCDRFAIPALIHGADRAMLTDPIRGVGPRIAQRFVDALWAEPRRGIEVADGDRRELAGVRIGVEHTPGHTPGSVAFRLRADGAADEAAVCTGDTLFRGTVGRTDFRGGDRRRLVESITTKLLTLPDDTLVLPGHGGDTTIGRERRANPALNGVGRGGGERAAGAGVTGLSTQ